MKRGQDDDAGSGGAAGEKVPPQWLLDRKCFACKKPLREHPGYKFCPRRPEQGAGGKAVKGGGKKGGKVPAHMKGLAGRTAPTAKHPTGRNICWDYHGKGCKLGNKCPKAHVCPRFLDGGIVCEGAHTAAECPHK